MQDQKEIIFDIFYLFIIEKVKMLFSQGINCKANWKLEAQVS